MARKKLTPSNGEAEPQPEGIAGSAAAPADETATPSSDAMVTVVKTGTAPKLSPRGEGDLSYQVGRMGDTILLRIHHNPSAGRFSKEWVSVEAIRSALARLPKDADTFKGALALRAAWKGQSACNSGFGAAILKAEGVFAEDAEKKGMLRLATPDALDEWEQKHLAARIPKGAEQVPLHPPKPVPNFAKRVPVSAGSIENPEASPDAEAPEPADAEVAGDAAPEEQEAEA